MIQLDDVSETSVLLRFSESIDMAAVPKIGEVAKCLKKLPEVVEVTPSYTTILVESGSLETGWEAFRNQVLRVAQETTAPESKQTRLHELPVFYDVSVGPDLEALAKKNGLTETEVIHLHSETIYQVCAIGFAPGFAFLAEVDERLAMPRKESPRARVARGSVGIANRQTAVYPEESPGGWQIIGNCPETLFDINADPMTPFSVGDRVRFFPMTEEAYVKKGGKRWGSK